MDAVEEWGELCRLASPGHRACEMKIAVLEHEISLLAETNTDLTRINEELKDLVTQLSTRDNPLDPAAHGQAMRDKPRQR